MKDSMEKSMENVREQIAALSLRAFKQGLFAGTSGNMSIYDRARDVMYITPTSVRYETMTPADIVALTLKTGVSAGGVPSTEWRMHAVIYERMPAVNAVFHTHSPYATAFAALRRPIPPVLTEMFPFLGGEVPCAAYAVPGTRAVGESAVEVLAGKGGCLMANHGVLAIGKDIAEAYIRAEYLEDAARVYHLAAQLGEPHVVKVEDLQP